MEFIYNDIKPDKKSGKRFKIKYPNDFEKWIEENLDTQIIYDRWKKLAHCKHCGSSWEYTDNIYKGELRSCPACGKIQIAMPHTVPYTADGNYFFWIWNHATSIRFAVIYASWEFVGKQKIKDIRDIVRITPCEIGEVSASKQESYEGLGNQWHQMNNVFVFESMNRSRIDYTKTEKILADSFLKHAEIKVKTNINYFVKELCLHARYPQMEYLRKAGLEELITRKIYGSPIGIRPNWKANTIHEFLRLSPQDIDKLKQWDCWTLDDIAFYKELKKHNKKIKKSHLLTVKEAMGQLGNYRRVYGKGMNIYHHAKYILKVMAEEKRPTLLGIWQFYGDYFNQLKALDYPLNDYYLYPKNFKEAHDRVSDEYRAEQERQRKIKDEKRAAEERRIEEKWQKEILPKLQKLSYSDEVHFIRPLEDREDFRKEGQNNKNCVFSYYERAIRGKVFIFVMRKHQASEESFVTIELDKNLKHINQCYATGNRIPDPEISLWVNEWLNNVVMRKKGVKTA